MRLMSHLVILLFAASACASAEPADGSSKPPYVASKIKTKERRERGYREVVSYYESDQGAEVRHGLSTEYRKDGSKAKEADYRDGKLEGETKAWYPNGNLATQHLYAQGRLVGIGTLWDEDGNRITEEAYEDGKCVRTTEFYYRQSDFDLAASAAKGRIHMETRRKNGFDVSFTRWHQNGTKAESGNYDEQGRQHGDWTFWQKDGSVSARGMWEHGKPFDGVCLVVGEGAGSMPPFVFNRYKEGKVLEKNLRIDRDK